MHERKPYRKPCERKKNQARPNRVNLMHPRIKIAKFLIRTGRFIQSAAVAVMRPNDLVEFSRRHYFKPDNVQIWCDEQLVNSGFSTLEQSLLDKISINQGQMLLLGLGGGREAIPMAKMGFEVTGVDSVPQMVERAKENAKKNGVRISCLV
jgi:2-polyprenyl-3-methyl-5-hydroxy-6-metoxy-1,4-benzoquinol methylase